MFPLSHLVSFLVVSTSYLAQYINIRPSISSLTFLKLWMNDSGTWTFTDTFPPPAKFFAGRNLPADGAYSVNKKNRVLF